jgi:hypothetical protein
MFQIETGIWLGYRLLRALCVLCTAPQRAASAQGTRRSRLEACCRLCGCSRCLLSLFSLRCALCCVLTGHWSLAIAALCACAAWHCREIPQYDLFGLRPVCPISSIHTKHDIVMRQRLSSCFLYL